MADMVLATLLLLDFLDEVDDFLLFCFFAGAVVLPPVWCMARIWRSILPEIISASTFPAFGDPTVLAMGVQSVEDSSSKTSGKRSSSDRNDVGVVSSALLREDRLGQDG